MSICPNCGLPLEACVCSDLAKKSQVVTIKKEKRKFGKVITVIEGLKDIDTQNLGKKLKMKLACGGKIDKDKIELQGDHLNKIKKILVEEGFDIKNISI
ncbi:MAG: stress response translation initiation inhibitor YciH [Candidatus Pacearchaeota archaeon]